MFEQLNDSVNEYGYETEDDGNFLHFYEQFPKECKAHFRLFKILLKAAERFIL
jgi:hypothetical protein